MKYTAIVFGLMLSLSSFAGEINGINYSSVKHETATKSYSDKIMYDHEIESAVQSMTASCKADQAEAEVFIVSEGYRVVSSNGCSVSVDNRNSDMALGGITLSTSFVVLYK